MRSTLLDSSSYSPMTTRAHRAWKDAWLSFRTLIWSRIDDPGWCWLSLALQDYRREESEVLEALRAEFEDLSWWESWADWNDRFEQRLPTSDDLREACSSLPLPSEMPPPPDEPEGMWARARGLWRSGDRRLAVGGAVIRVVLARGRTTREIRGD